MDEIREDAAGKGKLAQQEEALDQPMKIRLEEDQFVLWI